MRPREQRVHCDLVCVLRWHVHDVTDAMPRVRLPRVSSYLKYKAGF